jgi:large subunit ribosomal protein L4
MSKLECLVYGKNGEEQGKTTLPEKVFGRPVLKEVIHYMVRWQRAKARSGTHDVLTRSEMQGGKKKPFKQKGTGRARAGSSVSPHWVGGAVVHGPSPRSYEFRANKSVKVAGILSALSAKARQGEVRIVESLPECEGKTSSADKFIKSIAGGASKVLVVCEGGDVSQMKAFKNLQGVKVLSTTGMNVYDIIESGHLVLTKGAVSGLEVKYGN